MGMFEMFGNNNQNQNQNQNQNDNNNNANNNANNNNDNNDDNNNDNNDNNASIWDNNNNQNNQHQQHQNQQQNNSNQQQRTPDELFQEHIDSLGLTNGVDLNNLQEQIQEGNFDSLNQAFAAVAANTYKAAMQQMNTLVDNKIKVAQEEAVATSEKNVNQNFAVNSMKQSLPFTQDQNIGPVAEAALKQFMDKGASVENAIQKVAEFFKATANKVTGTNDNNPFNNNFNPNSNNNNNSNQNKKDDWMDVLTQQG